MEKGKIMAYFLIGALLVVYCHARPMDEDEDEEFNDMMDEQRAAKRLLEYLLDAKRACSRSDYYCSTHNDCCNKHCNYRIGRCR